MANEKTRTANLSPEAADMLAVLAREAGDRSVRAYVDRVWVPQMRGPYEQALEARIRRAKGETAAGA